MSELWRLPNLLSLSRIAITPVIGYFLWKGDDTSTLICAILLIVAGVTDSLDGMLARRMGLVSNLGKTLDPLADKAMAAALLVLLVLFRDLPLWLAAIIVGRDLLILVGGLVLLRGKKVTVSSNITGKYTFTAIAALLGSYVIRFDWGITVLTPITVALIALSTVLYARVFIKVKCGEGVPTFEDRPSYRYARLAALAGFSLLYLWELVRWLVYASRSFSG